MAETQYQNVDQELNDAVVARKAEWEAYRQRLIAADLDHTNFSPDYTERQGEDLDGDGYTWVVDLRQYVLLSVWEDGGPGEPQLPAIYGVPPFTLVEPGIEPGEWEFQLEPGTYSVNWDYGVEPGGGLVRVFIVSITNTSIDGQTEISADDEWYFYDDELPYDIVVGTGGELTMTLVPLPEPIYLVAGGGNVDVAGDSVNWWGGTGEYVFTWNFDAFPDGGQVTVSTDAFGTVTINGNAAPGTFTFRSDESYTIVLESGAFLDLFFPSSDTIVPLPEPLGVPSPSYTVDPVNNSIDVTWPAVPEATIYQVDVTVDSGTPAVYEFPQVTKATIFAPAAGDYEVGLRARSGFTEVSGTSAPIVETLDPTPLFQTGMWQPWGLVEPVTSLWHATPKGELLVYEIGFIDTIDYVNAHALVEYQLNTSGAPTLGDIHFVDFDPTDEDFPVYRNGDYMIFLRMNQGNSTLRLYSYDLTTDTLVDWIALTYQYPGALRTWDAGDLFVHVTDIGGVGKVEVVNMSDPTTLTIETSPTFAANNVSGVVITEGHCYVAGRDGANDQVMWVVSLPTPEVLNIAPWYSDSDIRIAALGPGWAVIILGDGRLLDWDLSDPLNPTFGSGIWLNSVFPNGQVLGVWQLLGDHATDTFRVESGSIGALIGGTDIMLWGDRNPFGTGDGAVYAQVDVSTPEARADMVLTDVVENATWGIVQPQARLGAVQTVGMIFDDGFTEKQWIFVGSTPAGVVAPAAPLG